MSWLTDAAKEAKNIPWWAWAGGGVVILFVGKNLLAGQSTDTGTDTTNPADVSDIGSTGTDITSSLGSSDGTSSLPIVPPATGGQGAVKPPAIGGSSTPTKTITVKSGDTLASIASHNHVDEPDLYNNNKTVIESTAKSHGFSSSDDGHWIFPGEVLKLPA